MTSFGRHLRAALWVVPLLALSGCNSDGHLAGGSSEVDNPLQITFVDGEGVAARVSGSLAVYASDQNPALNPSAIVSKRVEDGTGIILSAHDIVGHVPFNVLLVADDSTGGLLLRLSYDPAAGRYARDGIPGEPAASITVSRLVRYEAELDLPNDSGINRIFVPGSPFQAVMVDSTFVFEAIPEGEFPAHVLTSEGIELPLPEPITPGQPRRHQVDPDAPPVPRPHPPAPPVPPVVQAGPDRTVWIGSPTFLAGTVSGASLQDPRLALLWRQVPPIPQGTRAHIENPTSLGTRVQFPRPGLYRFALSAAMGPHRSSDTVTIGVHGAIELPAFIVPTESDTLRAGQPTEIAWEAGTQETLVLEFTRNGGATWTIFDAGYPSRPGINKRMWMPPGQNLPATCQIRLRTIAGEELARTGVFLVVSP